jgi:hypothetical protein
MNFLIDSILVGYGVYSIFLSFFRKRLEQWKDELIDKIDKAASIVFSVGGLILIFNLLVNIYLNYSFAIDDYEKFRILSRIFGKYWYGFWVPTGIYILATQLTWNNRIRRNRILRVVIGLLMLVSVEKLIIITTILHSNYDSEPYFSISSVIGITLINWLVYILIFATMVVAAYLILKNLKVFEYR